MKGEVISVIDKAKEAETNLTDQHKIIAEKEREINEIKSSLKFDSKTHNFDRVFPETTEIFKHIHDMDKSIEFRIKVSYFGIYDKNELSSIPERTFFITLPLTKVHPHTNRFLTLLIFQIEIENGGGRHHQGHVSFSAPQFQRNWAQRRISAKVHLREFAEVWFKNVQLWPSVPGNNDSSSGLWACRLTYRQGILFEKVQI